MPATFTIAPSGARLPFRPTTPPVGDSGLSAGRTTSWSGFHFTLFEVLGDRPAGHGHAVAVQEAVVEQRLHQQRHAASLEHVLGDIAAARFQVGDIGCPLEDLGDVEQVELDAAFVGDRRQMQRRVGRAAGGGDDGRGILQRLAGDDVARADVAARSGP